MKTEIQETLTPLRRVRNARQFLLGGLCGGLVTVALLTAIAATALPRARDAFARAMVMSSMVQAAYAGDWEIALRDSRIVVDELGAQERDDWVQQTLVQTGLAPFSSTSRELPHMIRLIAAEQLGNNIAREEALTGVIKAGISVAEVQEFAARFAANCDVWGRPPSWGTRYCAQLRRGSAAS